MTQHNPYSPDQATKPGAAPGNPYAPPAPGGPPGQPLTMTAELTGAVASIQSLQRTSSILRWIAIGLIVVSLVGSSALPGPLIALMFLARIVAWSACGVLSLIIGRKVAAIGQPAGGHYLNAAINLAVVAYLIFMIFQR